MAPKKDAPEPPKGGRKILAAAPAVRKQQYLVGRRAAPGIQPFSLSLLETNFQQNGIEIVRKLSPPAVLGAFAGDGPQEILVARMTSDQAQTIKESARGAVVIEPDHPVSLALPMPTLPAALSDPGVLPATTAFTVRITVLGRDNAPVEGANVYLFGSVWPAQGATDGNGQTVLSVFGETPATLKGLYVKPVADYWSFYLPDPPIDPAQENVVSLTPFDQAFPEFPVRQVFGWGQKAMKLDRLPAEFRGGGVKIGIIDSGAAQTHRDLQPVLKGGYDTIAQSTAADSWTVDTVMHGSHCAGIIAGADDGSGIRGFAPAADVYAYKIFPDGRFSNLIDALNRCIEDNVDVVNLSLGSDQRSDLVDQKLQELKDAGIACIVAAGNSGGAVQYPAASKHVLAVSAIGRRGVFPDDSYHGTTMLPETASRDGFFAARFSCFGPEIAVCGPGVAIVSSVPPNNYAAWDGTSMATPHITGLAALILAHHHDFAGAQAPFRQRNARRVERLFEVLKESAQPLNLGEKTRTGAGLPDATKALAVAAASAGSEIAAAGFEVRGIAQPPQGTGAAASGNGAAQSGRGDIDAAMQKLASTLERAGLAARGPATAAAGVAASSIDAEIERLTEAIDRARLGANGNGAPGALTTLSTAGAAIDSAMSQLTGKIRAAGLS